MEKVGISTICVSEIEDTTFVEHIVINFLKN